MIDHMFIAGLQCEHEGRNSLLEENLQYVLYLMLAQHVTLAISLLQRVPNEYAIFVDMRQVEAVALYQCVRSVQGTAGSQCVGNALLSQQCQGVSGVIGDLGLLV